ncbi:SDR family NAD(P)-dependent oxidoreductase [Nocardioides sp. MAH-18]|uniref:SDR family NAD(P)-dependent oxidoreductase n=1 Tax=Nocardioides agri TaxID=2682843 RepID=A0A6L6XNF9_9ACTN|nr:MULTISPECIES: SDR family NAD(P)-dependent oxidoreductase [unclassified Nocardioides]MBA2953258.1 SDR family NAD(P)-dependent oxidoreductase [Nocardioides sp. CGMCC 1.13656]MVQ48126.1 SDR family NAD(P)-dependent oxidoreductase [Nocardioides sp. MAH-18]
MDQQQETALAFVTGASTGIGRALAQQFVDNGFDVVVVADEDRIHSAAAELGAGGRRAIAVQADLTTADGVQTAWNAVRDTGRTPYAAALNAGIGVNGRFDQTALEDDLALVDLNVRSTVHLAKLLTREMVAAGQGRLLITSSIAAVAPGPYHATYATSKAFVHSFAEGIRTELRDTGVTVTSLMPGPTDTEFFSRADMEDTRIGQMEDKDDADDVARDGYEALMAGKASVVAGSFMNRVQAELGTHLPDALAAPILARMTKPQH